MTKFIVFIDGSNLFGSLRKLNLHVSRYEDFFNHILTKAIDSWHSSMISGEKEDARLVRVLWYEVGSIDEWDLSDSRVAATLKEWFDADLDLKARYLDLVGRQMSGQAQSVVIAAAWNACLMDIKSWYTNKKAQIKKSNDFHFAIKSGVDFVDVIPSGHLKVDILRRSVTEKGIDTSLAVDMLSLSDTYDVAILISGDADSIPSIERVKHKGKHVGVVEFLKGHPPEQKGRQSSSKLKATADFVIPIYETDLQRDGIATVWD